MDNENKLNIEKWSLNLNDKIKYMLSLESNFTFILTKNYIDPPSFFITLAGFPATNTLSGNDFVTTAAAAITVLFPILTPGRIVTPPPIHTLSPITTDLGIPICFFRDSTSNGCSIA